jgi:hypothetical protein
LVTVTVAAAVAVESDAARALVAPQAMRPIEANGAVKILMYSSASWAMMLRRSASGRAPL